MTSGGCRCGNISYQCDGEPAYVGNCHCMDCQKFSGAAYVSWATFRRSQFHLDEGEIKKVSCTPGITRGFCADCGTPLIWFSDDSAEWLDVTVGSIDNPMPFKPQSEAFVSRALPWVILDPNVPHFERGPFEHSKAFEAKPSDKVKQDKP